MKATSINSILAATIVAAAIILVFPAKAAGILDLLNRESRTTQAVNNAAFNDLSAEQVTSALKSALDKGVQQAIATLGKPGGFLNDPTVKIPMPNSLTQVEKTLRRLRQDKLADDFIGTMNSAAEQAVPVAVGVLADALKQMSIADAKSILTGTNNAATEYFRRASETNLYTRFLPLVKTATEKVGVTSSYKRMMDKVSGGFGGFGEWLGKQAPDLDDYVTRKTLDGLFVKIAEQEKQIRENPVARSTELLRKVFGVLQR